MGESGYRGEKKTCETVKYLIFDSKHATYICIFNQTYTLITQILRIFDSNRKYIFKSGAPL